MANRVHGTPEGRKHEKDDNPSVLSTLK